MLTEEGYISNYIGVNSNKNSYEEFKFLQPNVVEKIINP